jgi:tetraprenyl-beta-curcumene synthase
VRIHAAKQAGQEQLERWATLQAKASGLPWQEFLAGAAASVLPMHALIASAACDITHEHAIALDRAYLSIGALTTMLDSVVDYAQDLNKANPNFTEYYEDRQLLARRLTYVARHGIAQTGFLPNSGHHMMTLMGAVSYYISNPAANAEPARSTIAAIERELKPLILPTLAVMRTWRFVRNTCRPAVIVAQNE